MTGSLLALALAFAIYPGASPEGGGRGRRRRQTPRRARGLALLAVVSVGVLCVSLLGVPAGLLLACCVGPIVAVPVVRSTGERRAAGVPLTGLPFALDLGAAVLRSGAPVSAALEHAAPAAGDLAEPLVHAARLLRLGAGPVEAWHSLAADPRLVPLAAVSRRSATSGIRLAAAWEQLAGELRAERRSRALARAHRAGVFAMAPLGLCFLPAFVCLGVIPDVLGIARDVLAGTT